MIVYFDTSALVPLLITEPTSTTCRTVWSAADQRVTSVVTYVELAAALCMARRQDRLAPAEFHTVWNNAQSLWRRTSHSEVNPKVLSVAANVAIDQGLRGYDALHCASALLLADRDFVALSGDRVLLQAWGALGVNTVDPHSAHG